MKIEDNLTSADPLYYTTNGSRVDQGVRSERLLPLTIRVNSDDSEVLGGI